MHVAILQRGFSDKEHSRCGSCHGDNTFEAFNAIQLSEELVHHAICHPCGVVAPAGRYSVKFIEEQHARRSSARSPAHACRVSL